MICEFRLPGNDCNSYIPCIFSVSIQLCNFMRPLQVFILNVFRSYHSLMVVCNNKLETNLCLLWSNIIYYVFMYVCMHVCMYAYHVIYLPIYVCKYRYTYIHTYRFVKLSKDVANKRCANYAVA